MNTPYGQAAGTGAGGQDALATTLHSVVRFMRTVRLRSHILLLSLLVAGILGALYYVTAPRIYQSSASLYVQKRGGVSGDQMRSAGDTSKEMPTFSNLMSSPRVLAKALEHLPERYRGQFDEMTNLQAVMEMEKSLSVGYQFNTQILNLTYRSKDPKAAKVILGHLLGAYGYLMSQVNEGQSVDNLERLRESLDENKAQVLEKQAARFVLIQTTPDLMGTGDDKLIVPLEETKMIVAKRSEAIKELNDARRTAKGLQLAVQNGEDILEYAEVLKEHLLADSVGIGGQASITAAHLNETITDLKSELKNQQNGKGAAHPDVIALEQEIQTREQALREMSTKALNKMKSQGREVLATQLMGSAYQRYKQALANVDQLEIQFNQVKSDAIKTTMVSHQINDLNREIDQLNDERTSLLGMMTGVELNRGKLVHTEVTQAPTHPLKPVSPRLIVVGFLSLFIGTAAGLGVIWVLDVMDDRFRAPEELKLQLNTQILTMVPAMDQLDGDGFDAVLCHARPNSTEAESFRGLRTNLDFASGDTGRIVCTSTEPGDGKTTISSNMATAFAQSGRKTLIIDADMRRPGLSTLLELRDEQGLSAILRSEADVATSALENTRSTKVSGLDVISCGPRPLNPAELLSSERFANLLAWAETRYDQIIIDAPPVLAVSDPLIIARLVDGVVLVVRPDKDRRRMVIRAAESLHSLGCNLLGVVVNHLSGSDAGGYGYGYGSGYEYGAQDDEAVTQTEAPDKEAVVSLSMFATDQPASPVAVVDQKKAA